MVTYSYIRTYIYIFSKLNNTNNDNVAIIQVAKRGNIDASQFKLLSATSLMKVHS